MCGIAGIGCNDPNRPVDRSLLARMTAIMRHRGPDGEGFFHAPGVGLGVRRLSIIDPAGGDQPLANEDGTVTVIGNAEIYNHVELRERLRLAGHRFRTGSDVEVVAHLYEDDPDGFLHQLRGMFALALWDGRRRRLLLARDRLGIKPLLYALTPQGLVFGSELKAVLASGLLAPTRDATALRDLFTIGFVVSPRTLVTEVRRLPPGHWLSFQEGRAATRAYWDVSFPHRDEYDRRRTADQWAEALRERLEESVRLHLRSDVPVGAWLSGGIDSSSVTALMHRELQRPIHTFTLGFADGTVDELARGRLLDEYPDYLLVGHRTHCRTKHFELLPRAIWHREQPFGLGVDIAQLLIAAMAAKHVKVVLTGEGADENLGGYPWYLADKVLAPFAALPTLARRWIAALLARPGNRPGASRILLAPAALNRVRFCALIGRQTLADVPAGLFANEPGQAPPRPDQEAAEFDLPAAYATWHPFAQLNYLDLKFRMANSVVQNLDLMSMACSLEARVPFLDHPLVEFCATIPPWIKMRRWREKAVLRRAMRTLLPHEILRRKKFPLSAPTRDWLQGALPEFATAALSAQRLRDAGCFNPAAVASILVQHRSGAADHSRLLLLILGSQLWNDLFLRRFPPAAPTATAPPGAGTCPAE